MKRAIISLILDAVLFVIWSIAGIVEAIIEPSWMCLVYGGLMMSYLILTIGEALRVTRLARTQKTVEGDENEKNN